MSDKKYTKIVFFKDCYDNEKLIWKANKEYNIIGESKDLYVCECEPYLDENNDNNNAQKKINYGIEKSIINMYYLI